MDVKVDMLYCPHPLAINFLFEHKRRVSKVYSDVLGHFDVDHIAIAIIGDKNEFIFLSQTPSIEYNLLYSGLWKHDLSISSKFLHSGESKHWNELYHLEKYNELNYIKQVKNQITSGICAPIKYSGISLLYYFATKSKKYTNREEYDLLNEKDKLIKLGNYCFERMSKFISFDLLMEKRQAINRCSMPNSNVIKLVINNRVHT